MLKIKDLYILFFKQLFKVFKCLRNIQVSSLWLQASPASVVKPGHFLCCGIDLFHNGGLLIYSFLCMIIGLSNLVSMWKIQRKTFFQTRSERLIIIYVKEYINRPPLWKRSIGQAGCIFLGSPVQDRLFSLLWYWPGWPWLRRLPWSS